MTNKEYLMVMGLFLGVFAVGMDSFIISPLLITLSGDLHLTIEQAGLAVSVYGIVYAVGAPLLGPLSDRLFSRKAMMIVGLITFNVGTILCSLAWDIWSFYAFRAVAALGAAIFAPNVWSFIGGYFQSARMGKIMGIVMSALSLSIVAGVPIGSYIAAISSWHWTFISVVVIGIISLLILLVTIPVGKVKQTEPFRYWDQFSQVFKAQNGILALLITLTWMFAFYAMYTYLGTSIHYTLQLDTAQVGMVFLVYGAGNFIASFMGGWVLAKLGPKQSLIVNGVIASITIVLLPVFGGSLPMLLIVLTVLAFAEGFGVTSLVAFIATIVPANRATMMSLNSSFIYVGLTLGSSIGGVIWASSSYAVLGIVSGAANLLSVMIALSLKKQEPVLAAPASR